MEPYHKFIQVLLIIFILTGCNEDDGMEPLANQAPEITTLFSPGDEEANIDLNPELKWQFPSDPNGDDVKFDIYLDEQQSPSTLIASGLTSASYLIDEKLKANTTYYWKVVTSDHKGAKSESNISTFSTRPANNAELLIGKWILESRIEDDEVVELTSCEKQSFYQFNDDNTIILESYFIQNTGECEVSFASLNYKLTGSTIIRFTLDNVPEVSKFKINSISTTELILDTGFRIETLSRVL